MKHPLFGASFTARRIGAYSATVVVLVSLATAVASTGTGATGWRHVSATRAGSGESETIEFWQRGADAVLIESGQDGAVMEKRCTAGRLVESWETGRVVRQLSDPMKCFEFATDSFLGIVRAAEGPSFRASGDIDISGVRGTVYRSSSPTTEAVTIVIDDANRLPLRVEFRSGAVWEWEYPTRGESTGAPPTPREPSASVPVEVYRDLSSAEGATMLGLSALPGVLAGLPLTALFSYQPAERPGSVYAIWSAPSVSDGAVEGTPTVQMVITDLPPPSSGVGVEDMGGTLILTLEEDGRQVAISAPDRPTLVDAVRLLRPGIPVPAASSE